MEITVKHGGDTCQMAIVGEMCIYEAEEIKKELIASLAECDELEINLSQVSEMDSAGFQLLLMAKKSCEGSNKVLRLVDHSEAVFEVIDSYHMAAYFGDPILIPGRSKNAKDSAS